MDIFKAMKTRRSVRAFTDTPVSKDDIEKIIDCGRLACSAINIQPWEFVVVTGLEMRRQIAHTTDHGKFIAEAPVCVVVLCKDTKYYLEDGAAATQNILVAATACGLGGCWVAGDKKAYAETIREMIGAPEGYLLVSLIALGHPDEQPERAKRPLEDVLHWEQFRTPQSQEVIQ